MHEFRRISDMLLHPGIASLHPFCIPASVSPEQIMPGNWSTGHMPFTDLCGLLRVEEYSISGRTVAQ
jgi:hypothetical protein